MDLESGAKYVLTPLVEEQRGADQGIGKSNRKDGDRQRQDQGSLLRY